jgi:hypothetical protein
MQLWCAWAQVSPHFSSQSESLGEGCVLAQELLVSLDEWPQTRLRLR